MTLMMQKGTQDRKATNSGSVMEAMFLESRPRFLALAYSILRNREDAEDAVQEAFVSALRSLPAFEGRSALTTWFSRIVMNACLMLLRKRKSSRLVAAPETGNEEETSWIERVQGSKPDPEMLCAEKETLQMVDTLLRTAGPSLRAAFQLKHYDDVSAEEGAKHFGITANTFKSRLFRARRHLRVRGNHALIAPIRRPAARSASSRSGFSRAAA